MHRPIFTLGQQSFITAKQSIHKTLAHRAKIVSSNQEALDQELQHIRRALQACQFQIGHLTNFSKDFKGTTNPTMTPITGITLQIQTTITLPTATTTGTLQLWSHTFMEQEKGLIRFANPKAYKYISRAPTPSEYYWSHLRIRIQYYIKLVSSTTSSAPTPTVQMHT